MEVVPTIDLRDAGDTVAAAIDAACREVGFFQIVVADDQVEKVTLSLQEACQTGKIGDGKIFVLPVEDAIRIRTGEHGDAAVSVS